ncbi:MAG TPA: hypothetical protein VEU51_01460 [Candidatus Acidoferrales bacterium]|nr:hypothetical protein [Candidatus Acidoferrales bacterium]
MGNVRAVLVVPILALMVASCGSSGGGAAAGPTDVGGCKIDAAKICAGARGQPVNMSGMTADRRMVEQNSEHTAQVFLPIKDPDGNELVEVECGINYQKDSVVYASVKAGPKMTEDHLKYLRAQGICEP